MIQFLSDMWVDVSFRCVKRTFIFQIDRFVQIRNVIGFGFDWIDEFYFKENVLILKLEHFLIDPFFDFLENSKNIYELYVKGLYPPITMLLKME